MNYPQLLTTMDPTKFWLNRERKVQGIFERYSEDWSNWPKTFGIPAIRKAFHKIPQMFVDNMMIAFGQPAEIGDNVPL